MKKILLSLFIILVIFLALPYSAEAKIIRVKSYFKPSSGRFVMPHFKTSPNKTKFDNWSTKGNFNPFTGKKGYVSPFKIYKPK